MRAAAWPVPVLLAAAAVCCGRSGPPAPPATASTAAVDPATAAVVTGHVRFAGAVPAAAFVRIDADPACVALNGGDRQPDETVVAGRDGGMPNTFVYVRAGLEKMTFPVPNEPVVLDQQRCRYLPRVVGVRVGQTLRLRNGDPLLHNVRSDGEVNQPFNQGQPVQGMTFDHTFTTREVMVPIACDVHRWMRAYVGALEHPYFAVTDEAGAFTLTNLPPGTYTLAAWHERLGTSDQQITVSAKESKDVEFTFAR
jgi:plastocyanin